MIRPRSFVAVAVVLLALPAVLLADDPPPTFPGAAAGVPALIQSTFGPKKMNFELVSPVATGGLMHFWRHNSDSTDPEDMSWHGPAYFGSLDRADAVTLIQSNYGNLELVARVGDRLEYYWRDSGPQYAWQGPYVIGRAARGNPVLIQSRFGKKGNFEMVVPSVAGGIDFYWRNNDDPKMPWAGPFGIAKSLRMVDAVTLIQGNYDEPGNLEMVARVGERLAYFWRDSTKALVWHGPYFIAGQGAGNPVLIQSRFGKKGNFDMLVPSARGGTDFYWRNNDDPKMPWAGPYRISEIGRTEKVAALTFIQSSYGTPGNFEIVYRVGDRLDYAFRVDKTWRGPFALTAPMELPPPDAQKPEPLLRKAYVEHLGRLVTAPGKRGATDLGEFGMGGTDLGASFEIKGGRLAFVFGDTWMVPANQKPPIAGDDRDSLAWTDAASVDRFRIPSLRFHTTGGKFTRLSVPSAKHMGMEVPVEGLAAGNRNYVFFVSHWSERKPEPGLYGYSILAHVDGIDPVKPLSFQLDHRVPSERFLNVSTIVDGGMVYIWGAGNPYRHTPVYLARVPVAQLADRRAWTYYRGLRDGRPVFGPWESSAWPLIDTPCVGELSVRRQPGTGWYLMAYNCSWPPDKDPPHRMRGHHFRTAQTPWGHWSKPTLLLDVDAAQADQGYGVTMHHKVIDGAGFDDGLAEFDHKDGDGWGGEYAPYIVPRWSRSLGNGVHSLVYLHSMWHPYKVSLMRTILVEKGATATRPNYAAGVPAAEIPDFSKWAGTGAPFGAFDHGGQRWLSTHNKAAGGDAVMGAIWYDLRVDQRLTEIKFRVHGGHGAVKLYRGGEVVRETRGWRTNDWDLEVRWFVGEFQGETARIVVEDTATDAWGFISVSPIELVRDLVPAKPIVR